MAPSRQNLVTAGSAGRSAAQTLTWSLTATWTLTSRLHVGAVGGSGATTPDCVRYLRMLSFQRLDVYRRAIELLALASDITNELPRGHAERADQLVRGAESVVRNIAEGA